MVRRTNLEVVDIIEAFVEGTGRNWDWDDFCSLKIEDRELDAIRLKCINLAFTDRVFADHRREREEFLIGEF